MADITINLDTQKMLSHYDRLLKNATAMITLQIIKDTDKYVPFDTGATAKSAQVASNPKAGRIVYDTPYAQKIYEGDRMNFSRDAHPLACAHWADVSKGQYLGEWTDKVRKMVTSLYRV